MTILGGTIVVETAVTTGRLSFKFIPNPVGVASLVLKASRAARKALTIKCTRCGKNLDPGWNLCPFCGLEISPLDIPAGSLNA